MKLLFLILSIFISPFAWSNENFRFTFNGIVGENLYSMEGMNNELMQFYCPTYNTVTLLQKSDGKKIFDMNATNCESIKSFISLSLLSGSKPYVVYNPFKKEFIKWGYTNSQDGICRSQ